MPQVPNSPANTSLTARSDFESLPSAWWCRVQRCCAGDGSGGTVSSQRKQLLEKGASIQHAAENVSFNCCWNLRFNPSPSSTFTHPPQMISSRSSSLLFRWISCSPAKFLRRFASRGKGAGEGFVILSLSCRKYKASGLRGNCLSFFGLKT